MLKIEDDISVFILDPTLDADKLGSRYCTGGYIWQVCDKHGRELLSGPCYPSATPPRFDGQGMPEVFETPLGNDDCSIGEDVCVIGVGLVKKESDIKPFHPRNNPRVIEFCKWKITRGRDYVTMITEQTHDDKSIKLTREVRVCGGTVISENTIENLGGVDLNLRWFSHPFFPLNKNLTCGTAHPKITMPQNNGYETDATGKIFMKPDYDWKKGLFLELALPQPQTKLRFDIEHPVCGEINFETSYDAARLALWANSQTFSFEPFLHRTVCAGEKFSWDVSISFLHV